MTTINLKECFETQLPELFDNLIEETVIYVDDNLDANLDDDLSDDLDDDKEKEKKTLMENIIKLTKIIEDTENYILNNELSDTEKDWIQMYYSTNKRAYNSILKLTEKTENYQRPTVRIRK